MISTPPPLDLHFSEVGHFPLILLTLLDIKWSSGGEGVVCPHRGLLTLCVDYTHLPAVYRGLRAFRVHSSTSELEVVDLERLNLSGHDLTAPLSAPLVLARNPLFAGLCSMFSTISTLCYPPTP